MTDTVPTAPVSGVPVETGSSESVAGSAKQESSNIDDYISDEEYNKLAKRKVKTKVDGKEVALTFEEMQKGYSHSAAANKKFQEAAAERKAIAAEKQEMEKQLAQLKDPKAARAFLAKHLGEDGFSNLAHETVMEQLRREAMTPEEIQREADEAELNEYRSSKQKAAEEAKQTEYKASVEKYQEDVARDLKEFMSKTGKVPPPHEMESLLSVMLNSLEEGYELSLDEAYAFVQKQESERWERYLASVDVEQLPKDFIEKVRKLSVASLPFKAGQRTEQPLNKPIPKEDSVDASEFFKQLRKGK